MGLTRAPAHADNTVMLQTVRKMTSMVPGPGSVLSALRRLLSVFPAITFLPDFAIAAVYLAAWVVPALVPVSVLRLLAPLMLVEFLLMHSAALMGGFGWAGAHDKTFRLVGVFLGSCYLFILYVMTTGMRAEWLFVPIAWLLFSKTLKFLSPLPVMGARQLKYAVFSWFGTALIYCGTVGLAFIMVLPQLGMKAPFTSYVRIRGGDQLFDDPQNMLAWGFWYFLLTGLLHLQLNYLAQKNKDKPDEPAIPNTSSEAA